MERNYYEINEAAAKRAKEMMSFSDYVAGSKTREYRSYVDKAYDLADKVAKQKPEEAERAYRLADRYSRKMAENMNNDSRIGCMCPSVMIAGPARFPVRKKEKQNAASDRNYQQFNEIQGILKKIENILYSKEIIKSDDERAVEKLEEKLAELRDEQELMKAVNSYYRKNGNLDECDLLTQKQKAAIESVMKEERSSRRAPFLPWQLSNNNQNIHSTEERLKRLKAIKARDTSEVEYNSFKVVENTEAMRYQIIFEGKPEPEIRDILKSNGFKWAPSQGAWQRQITGNGKYALDKVIKRLKELEESA